ncbi:MAG: hypothetical protein LKI39_02620 [Bacteroides sp.]|jgi:hypothetical protein|nr:hypothetical protein [Bacteroides sp.]
MKAVITLSKKFFKGHPKEGEETGFAEKVLSGNKIHTCRANYDYWAKKIARLKQTNGTLCIRQWSGKPYRSPQITIIDIPASRIEVQKMTFKPFIFHPELIVIYVDGKGQISEEVAANDGLSLKDYQAWFKGYDLNKPMAVIQFTNFKY